MNGPARHAPRWRTALRYAWLVLVVLAVALVLLDRWDEVGPELQGAHAGWLAVSGLLALAGVGCSGGIWRALLAGLGSRLPLAGAVRVFFVGQLGKYLPGSVWPVLVQAELGRDYEVPPRASVSAVVLFLWTHLLTGAAVAAVALALAGAAPAPVALLAVPALLLLAPGLLGHVLTRVLRLAGREPLPALPGRASIMVAGCWAAAMWLAYGLHLAAVVAALGHPADLPLATGAFAAAWCAGFAFVIAPAGAGVREAVMTALLVPAVGPGAAIAATLLSRLLVTVADVAWGLAGLSSRRRPASRS